MIDDFKTDNEQIDSQSFTVTIQIPAANVWAMLTSAFEGGSNYWIRNVSVYKNSNYNGQSARFLQDIPFLDGALRFRVYERPDNIVCNDEGYCTRLLNHESLMRGLQIMQKHFTRHFANFLKDTGDAETGDVFLQCCLFDDVIYG